MAGLHVGRVEDGSDSLPGAAIIVSLAQIAAGQITNSADLGHNFIQLGHFVPPVKM